MKHSLSPYPAYKDSGLPWLGAVPAHWQVLRQRNVADMLVSNVDKHTKEGELQVRLCNYVDVYKNECITDQLSFMRATATPDEVARFRLQKGDVLITKDSEAWNDIGVPALVEFEAPDLICGYHLALLRPRQSLINGPFLLRVLQSRPVAYQYHVAANGVTRYGLSHDAIKSVSLPIPPADEQRAIVKFLDHLDRKVRAYIRARKKLIALLNEQKQAIIHHAVTRGLDPNVKLKPSGVEWLGDIPEHWDVYRLKYVTSPIEQGWSPQCDGQPAGANEWGVLKVGCVNGDEFNQNQNKRLPNSLSPEPRLEIQSGDILVSRANTRELLGLAAIVEGCRRKLILCDKLFRFRALPRAADGQYLVFAIRGRTSRAQIETSTNGASDSMQNIGQRTIQNLWIALPPYDEQINVVQYVDTRAIPLKHGVSKLEREIALMREYHTRLIADVVTGKLDVRAAAAGLPEEVTAKPPEEYVLEDEGEADVSDLGEEPDIESEPTD